MVVHRSATSPAVIGAVRRGRCSSLAGKGDDVRAGTVSLVSSDFRARSHRGPVSGTAGQVQRRRVDEPVQHLADLLTVLGEDPDRE